MKKNLGAKNWMFPMPVLMVGTYGEDGTPDVMNAAWGGITLEDEITICIDTAHKTWANIAERKTFTVAFGTADAVRACDYLGLVSGNKTPDKVARSGLTVTKSAFVDAPVVNELPLALECELVSMNEENCNVVGKIVNCAVEESAMTDGLPNAEKVKDTTLDECIDLGEKVVNERKHSDGMPHVTNRWCRYCKHCDSGPGVDTLTETVKSGGLARLSVPKRLAVIDELETILKRAKEVAKVQLALQPGKVLEDEGIRYAIHEVNGPSSLAEGKMVDLFATCSALGIGADAVMSVCKVGKSDICRVIKDKTGLKLRAKDPSEVTVESVVAPFFTCRKVEKLVREA